MLSASHLQDMTGSVERVAVSSLLRGQFAAAAQDVYAFAEDCHENLTDTDRVACGPGCDRCCVVNVSVLGPEAEVIADYLRQTLSEDALARLQSRLESLHRNTRWLDDEERIMTNQRCAFVDGDGLCSIYPVRPLLCRSVTSADSDDCRTAMSMLALGESHPVMSNLIQKEIFETAFVGLGQALRTCGLDDRSTRLTGAVLARLADGDEPAAPLVEPPPLP